MGVHVGVFRIQSVFPEKIMFKQLSRGFGWSSFLIALLSIAALGQAAAPAAARRRSNPMTQIKFEKYTLKNGLDVILHEDHRLPLVAVNIWYHVGPANERPGRTGFAHLFEHMMFEGSQHVGP